MALSWKVCSLKCITWDTTLRAGQGLPQEKVPDGYIRISPSLSCNTEFPSIMFLSMLLACPLENAWSVEQMPLFFPNNEAWAFWAGGLVSYVEAWADPLLIDQQFHCLVFWSLLTKVLSSVCDFYKGWIVGYGENPDLKCPIPVRSAVMCSCWAHLRKEARGDWLTGKENQGHDLWSPWKLLTFKLVRKCARREKEVKQWLYFFSRSPVGI